LSPAAIDASSYLAEIRDAEAKLIYKSLNIIPVLEGQFIWFDIENIGNIDLELLMLEVLVPDEVVKQDWYPPRVSGVDHSYKIQDGRKYRWIACYSQRGTYEDYPPMLRPIITPTMGKVRPKLSIMLRQPLSEDELQLTILFQLHSIGYNTKLEERKLAEVG
jgi:hypothetical protein